MSSNFLINSIDPTNKQSRNQININPKDIEKILQKQQKLEKNQNVESYQDEKDLISLEKSYKDSLILLQILEKNAEKNIFEKYNTKNDSLVEKDIQKIMNNSQNDIINNILMKKKF